ncbi:MAG: hypothetical protein M3118_06235, partial [Actinomycetota bacterium]|nr:hypothetical protein [Actinomycetota bacterium]
MKTISSTAMPAGRIAAFGLGLVLMVALLVLLAPRPAYAATFTVNQTGDAKDRNINNSVCDVSRKNGNQCTLRAAIQEANNTPGADTIDFNISGTASVKTIKPVRPLPEITEAVTINGYSQGSATTTTSDDAKENTLDEGNDAVLKVQLNGTDAGPTHGLVIQASDSTIKGLVINRFVGNGILISGSGATGNKVLGNFVGTNASGTADLGNGGEGVEIFDASDNTVGGAREAARNVISGNGDDGVDLQGVNTKDNKIEGNFIGTKASSTQALGNGAHGVNIRSGADDNTVGGTASEASNRIAHNGQDGVFVEGGLAAVGNSVLSNFIFSNTGLRIDLGTSGVTNNDTDDPDTGANNLQNFLVITSATRLSTG